MAREVRIGLMLAAAACLTAVLVDWVVEELTGEATLATAAVPRATAAVPVPQAREAEHASVEASREDTGVTQDATEESHVQG
jgi:ribosomal protein L12E/L44/L45/RPP1/RPP2